MLPGSASPNRLAAWSVSRKAYAVVWWSGTARAPVVGSGSAPAGTCRVSKLQDEDGPVICCLRAGMTGSLRAAGDAGACVGRGQAPGSTADSGGAIAVLSLIHISEPTRLGMISY